MPTWTSTCCHISWNNMIYKDELTIDNNCTVSPKELPTVFVTVCIENYATIVNAGITGHRNKWKRLAPGGKLRHCGFEFRLLSRYETGKGKRTAKVAVVKEDFDNLDAIFGLRSSNRSLHFQMPNSLFGIVIPDRIIGFRVPGRTRALPFEEWEIQSIGQSLACMEANVKKGFANEKTHAEQVSNQFKLLSSLLHSMSRKLWYKALFGALNMLSVAFGVDVVEVVAAAFSGVTKRYFAT